jgi:hypothetical protein
MGRITKELRIGGAKGIKVIKEVLFDGGASHSFMRLDTSNAIGNVVPFKDAGGIERPKQITLADGETKITAIGTCTFDTKINEIDVRDEAWVVEKLGQEMIVGADTLQRYGIELKYAEKGRGGDKIVAIPRDEIAWL